MPLVQNSPWTWCYHYHAPTAGIIFLGLKALSFHLSSEKPLQLFSSELKSFFSIIETCLLYTHSHHTTNSFYLSVSATQQPTNLLKRCGQLISEQTNHLDTELITCDRESVHRSFCRHLTKLSTPQEGESFLHSSLQHRFSSLCFAGICLCTALLSSFLTISVRLRFPLGICITLILFLFTVVLLLVCLGSLSYCIT